MIKKLIKLLPLIVVYILHINTIALADDGSGAMIIHASHEQTQMYGGSEVANLNPELRKDITLGIGEVYSVDNKCLPINKYNDYDVNKTGGTCSLCAIFEVFFDTLNGLAKRADKAFSSPMISVVAVGFAIWLAIYLLGYLSSFETRDIKDAFQEIIIKGALVILSVVILTNGSCNFYNSFINPVYETFLRGAKVALKVDLGSENKVDSSAAVVSGKVSDGGGLPQTMKSSIIETMTAMERGVSKMRAIGSSFMCYSISKEKRILYIIPKFSYLLTGLFYWVMAMAMITIVPLLMIDMVFELTVGMVLLPLAIASYPFKPLRQYSKKVWETFLNSGFAFLFMALVVVMILAVFEQSIKDAFVGIEINGEDASQKDWAGLFDITKNDDKLMDVYLQKLGWFGFPAMEMLFCFVLAWAVMNLGKEFADEFASSISSTTIGSSIGTMGFSAVKGMSSRVLAPIGNAASEKAGHAAASVVRGTAGFVGGKVQKARMNGWQRKASQGTRQADGTTVYTGRDWLGRKATYTQSADGTISKQRKRLFGIMGDKKVEMNNIGGITIKQKTKYNRDGTVKKISDSVTARDRLAKELISADGSIDGKIYNKLSENLSPEQRAAFEQKVFAFVASKNLNSKTKGSGNTISQSFERGEDGKMRQISKTDKGETVITEMQMVGNRFILSRAIVDANGNAMVMTTDGLKNKLEEYKTSGGRTIDEISANQQANKHGSFERKTATGYSRYYNAQTASESLIKDETKLYNGVGQYSGYINDKGEFFDKNGKLVARIKRDEDGNEMRRGRFGEHEAYSVKTGPDGHMRKFDYRDDGSIKWGAEVDSKPVVFEAVDGSGTFSLQNGRLTNKQTGETYGGGRASESRYSKQFREVNNLFDNNDSGTGLFRSW